MNTASAQDNRQVARFGPFEAYLRTGELRKSGLRIKIQDQPFQVLASLLEKPGELITREELQKRLWPETLFMDFDHGLNIAVKKLRAALNDSSETPRYIETLARKGYRFIAPVEFASPGATVTSTQATVAGRGRAKRLPEKAFVWIGVALLVTAVLTAAFLAFHSRPATPTVTVLTSYDGDVWGPQISPDDTRLAFLWVKNELDRGLYEKVIGTDNAIKLLDGKRGEGLGFAWSPDGAQIAIVKKESPGHGALYLMPALGGDLRKVTDLPDTNALYIGQHRTLAWSPDGNLLAFTGRASPQEPFGIMLLDLRTLEIKSLTKPVKDDLGDADPAFLPDGKLLVFTRMHDPVVNDIYSLPILGGTPRRLTYENTMVMGLTITGDGKEIVFSSDVQGPLSLFHVPIAGGKASLLFMSSEEMVRPFALRMGRRIAYVQSRSNGTIWRYRLSPDHIAHDATKIVSSSREQACGRLSPDGTQIVFNSDRSGWWNLWLATRDGGAAKQITFMKAPGSPAWSPDEKQIAFDLFTGPHSDIFVMDTAGGAPRRVTDGTTNNYMPFWSQDGSSLYFTSLRSGTQQVWKLALADGRLIQVTRHGAWASQGAPGGKMLYFWRDGVIWRMPIDGGEDEFVVKAPDPSSWVVGKGGLYFYEVDKTGAAIQYLDFATKRLTTVLAPVPPPHWCWSMSVSEAEDTLTYVASERSGSEIRLLDLH